MKIDNGKLTLPPASELQDGFDLFYQRRSLRKTYEYEVEGEQFSLTVCKDQARNVCPYEQDTKNIEEIPTKVFHAFYLERLESAKIHVWVDNFNRAAHENMAL